MGGTRYGRVSGGRSALASASTTGGSIPPLCLTWLSCAIVSGKGLANILFGHGQLHNATGRSFARRRVQLGSRRTLLALWAGSGFLPLFGTN